MFAAHANQCRDDCAKAVIGSPAETGWAGSSSWRTTLLRQPAENYSRITAAGRPAPGSGVSKAAGLLFLR